MSYRCLVSNKPFYCYSKSGADKRVHFFIMQVASKCKIIGSMLLYVVFSAQSATKSLQVAVGWTKPPYVISENNQGFELELVTAVLK